jgi:hypothetical protein
MESCVLQKVELSQPNLTPGLTSVSADSISTAMGSRWYPIPDYPYRNGPRSGQRADILYRYRISYPPHFIFPFRAYVMSHTLSRSVAHTQVRMVKMTRTAGRRVSGSITLSKMTFTSFLTYPSGPRRHTRHPPLMLLHWDSTKCSLQIRVECATTALPLSSLSLPFTFSSRLFSQYGLFGRDRPEESELTLNRSSLGPECLFSPPFPSSLV